MVKAIVYAISKVNDFKVLLLPNGEFAPMETTKKLHLEDEIKQEIYRNLYICTELKDFRNRNRRCVLLLDALNRKDTY